MEKYTITVSNYTCKVEGALSMKFMKAEKSRKCFASFAKIKKDIRLSNVHVDIDRRDVSYYDTNLKPLKIKTLYNVDLKSAYATVLLNSGIITKETYKYICSLPKPDRLACVGMLASHQHIFTYEGGEPVCMPEEKRSEFEAYFYFCCMKTFEVMQSVKKICSKNSYLFSWVDSIYFKNEKDAQKIIDHLKVSGFNSTFEKLTNMQVSNKINHYKVEFFNASGKKKVFNIPIKDSTFARDIVSKYVYSKHKYNFDDEQC